MVISQIAAQFGQIRESFFVQFSYFVHFTYMYIVVAVKLLCVMITLLQVTQMTLDSFKGIMYV